MKIKTVNNYYTDENTYIVYDENKKECEKNELIKNTSHCNHRI